MNDAHDDNDASPEIGDLFELKETLQHWSPAESGFNYLLLISFTTLGVKQEQASVQQALEEVFLNFAHARGAHVFRLSPLDTAILIKLQEFNRLETAVDLKVDVMRVVQHRLPEYFSKIDQGRLIRSIDLNAKLQTAVRFLETYVDRSKETGTDEKGERVLSTNDIQKLREALRKLGPKEFAKRYIRSQTAVVAVPGDRPKPVMTEYYVGLDLLKQNILRGVQISGAGNIFNQLTLTFDQALLYCFKAMELERRKTSLNMNVETVFTNAFENFLRDGGDHGLNEVVLEFRQENVFQHFNQFQAASDLILSRGGTIAIDNVQPETLGFVNLHRLNVKMAKIMWRAESEDVLLQAKDDIRAMQEGGTVMVLAHVDDQQAIRVGQRLGISMFQGYFVDKMLG